MWSPSLTGISMMRPKPCAVIFVYVVGLISPEAVTTDTSESCFATLAVWTVTTPLLAWFTLYQTMPPRHRTPATTMPTFCHVFMRFLPRFSRNLTLRDTMNRGFFRPLFNTASVGQMFRRVNRGQVWPRGQLSISTLPDLRQADTSYCSSKPKEKKELRCL